MGNANDVFLMQLARAKKQAAEEDALRLATMDELLPMLDAARERKDWWAMQRVLTRIINARG